VVDAADRRAQTVLALQYRETERTRGPLEWALALLLYAVIALAVMLWSGR